MVLGRRPHQRRFAEPLLARIDIGATRREQPHGGHAARPCGGHQCRLAFGVGAVGAHAGVEHHLDERGAAVARRQTERRDAVSIRGGRARAG